MSAEPRIAIVYDDDAYVERLKRPQTSVAGTALGLMGRQVAGREFLDAYLQHGNWEKLTSLVSSRNRAGGLIDACKTHPSSRHRQRRLQLIELSDFQEFFCSSSPAATVLHAPCPPDARFAWARHHAGHHSFAMSGVTHTLCSLGGVEMLRQLVIAPFVEYDRLICTSRAVYDMVRAVTASYADHLGLTSRSQPRIRLETIPLGVNTDRWQPASPADRAEIRQRLGIGSDEIVVLFVGRMAHHAKAHPFPMFRSVSAAASKTRQPVRLLIAGWAVSQTVANHFREGATHFAPGVRTTFVDGTDPQLRFAVWHAADVFASLVDNIQETFGLVLLEAMACGLPVVASDWNGYRDLVVDGETGLLVPTRMVRDATQDTTVRLLTGEINYDHFLAECNQTVSLDVLAATNAFSRLFADVQLRKRMGEWGRRRAVANFAWQQIIAAYERLWREQDAERQACRNDISRSRSRVCGPAAYPVPDISFATYPSDWVDDHQVVRAVEGAANRLDQVLSQPLTNYEADRRCDERHVLRNLLYQASNSCSISQLDGVLQQAGIGRVKGRATVAWLLKYDLLRCVGGTSEKRLDCEVHTDVPVRLCFVTTCMGRLESLKQTLPRMVNQPQCSCLVVDYSCPDGAGDWVEANFPQVQVVRCPGQTTFHRSQAKNAGGLAASTPWICFIDADIMLSPEFANRVVPLLKPGKFYRAHLVDEGTGGSIICASGDFRQVGGHDLNYEGCGEEDDDLCDALRFRGVTEQHYSASLIEHIHHSDEMRQQFHAANCQTSHLINRLYRVVKWDITRLLQNALTNDHSRQLYYTVSDQVSAALDTGGNVELKFDLGSLQWAPLDAGCRRRLSYKVAIPTQPTVEP